MMANSCDCAGNDATRRLSPARRILTGDACRYERRYNILPLFCLSMKSCWPIEFYCTCAEAHKLDVTIEAFIQLPRIYSNILRWTMTLINTARVYLFFIFSHRRLRKFIFIWGKKKMFKPMFKPIVCNYPDRGGDGLEVNGYLDPFFKIINPFLIRNEKVRLSSREYKGKDITRFLNWRWPRVFRLCCVYRPSSPPVSEAIASLHHPAYFSYIYPTGCFVLNSQRIRKTDGAQEKWPAIH